MHELNHRLIIDAHDLGNVIILALLNIIQRNESGVDAVRFYQKTIHILYVDCILVFQIKIIHLNIS